MLDVRRLRVLRAVAQHGSFSAAAEALSYTQSAVSQQIAALEREAGAVLVERGARGVRLTDAGRALVAHAEDILARLDAAERELEAIAGLRGGRVRLVAFSSAAASIVPPAIAEFRRCHPGVELSLEPREPVDAVACLKAGVCDVAVALEPTFLPFEDEAIVKTYLLDDPMHVALPRDHELARAPELRLEHLAGEAWVLGSLEICPDTTILLRACAAAGFEPRIAFHNDDYTAIQGFIAAGVGVALIPDLALVSIRDDIVVRDLAGPPPVRRVFAATTTAGRSSPGAEAMVATLQRAGETWQRHHARLAFAA
jgi:molybdate transport repressor ModE-like protein